MDDSNVQLLHDSRVSLRQSNAYVLFYMRTDLDYIPPSPSSRAPAKRKASQLEADDNDDGGGGTKETPESQRQKRPIIGPQVPPGWKRVSSSSPVPASSSPTANGVAGSTKIASVPLKPAVSVNGRGAADDGEEEEIGVKVDRKELGRADFKASGKKLRLADGMKRRPAIIR
jgi:hypothetical protein